jgi:hypothetical protein
MSLLYQTDFPWDSPVNKYGCYFMSLAYYGNKIGNRYTVDSLIKIWGKAVKLKIISGDLNNDGDVDDAGEKVSSSTRTDYAVSSTFPCAISINTFLSRHLYRRINSSSRLGTIQGPSIFTSWSALRVPWSTIRFVEGLSRCAKGGHRAYEYTR